MASVEMSPAPSELAGELLLPQLFGSNPPIPVKGAHGRAPGRKSKPVAPRRAGQKLLLEAKDFVLPELVKHADNGDLSVSIAPSTDAVQLEQILRLVECG